MGDNNKMLSQIIDTSVADNADDNDELLDSGDEALLEMLGLTKSAVVNGIREEDAENMAEVVGSEATIMAAAAAARSSSSLDHLVSVSDSRLQDIIVTRHNLADIYDQDRVVRFPGALCLPASFMRRITEEVVWSNNSSISNNNNSMSGGGSVSSTAKTAVYYPSDKTYETIRVIRKRARQPAGLYVRQQQKLQEREKQIETGEESNHQEQQPHPNHDERPEEEEEEEDDYCDVYYEERRCLTRLEDFCRHHPEWKRLCDYIGRILSLTCGTEMVLYKEKLNLKPGFGGSGFAPHLDTPSLLVAAQQQEFVTAARQDTGDEAAAAAAAAGPTSFVTVMVAIDDMTDKNGCLRVVKGPWSKDNAVATIVPEKNGNPDADGRAGAIPTDVADTLQFESICCKGGTIVAFDGWVPHRSAANTSPFGRRAVFLTYNPKSQGDFHETYYRRMHNLRNQWRTKMGLLATNDEQKELEALSTIPRI